VGRVRDGKSGEGEEWTWEEGARRCEAMEAAAGCYETETGLAVWTAAFAVVHAGVKEASAWASAVYRAGDAPFRFDWEQRGVNVLAQLAQTLFHIYVMFLDESVKDDLVFGFSRSAHHGYVAICAFYCYDAVLYASHPRLNPFSRYGWLAHHVIAIALLAMIFRLQRGALAASSLLISSAAHIASELRWFGFKLRGEGRQSALFVNTMNVVCAAAVFLSCIMAPLYMLFAIARHTGIARHRLFLDLMRWQCLAGLATVLIPHCILFAVLVRRSVVEWVTVTKQHRL